MAASRGFEAPERRYEPPWAHDMMELYLAPSLHIVFMVFSGDLLVPATTCIWKQLYVMHIKDTYLICGILQVRRCAHQPTAVTHAVQVYHVHRQHPQFMIHPTAQSR